MNSAERQAVFSSQTRNVRRLISAKKQLRRSINSALRRSDEPAEEAHTLVLGLLYCAWVEARFSKMIHTPHGFADAEIEQIKEDQSRNGVSSAWKKAVSLGVRRVNSERSNYAPNIRRKLEALIDSYVRDPSLVRNKIAHGQWAVALNRKNTAPNPDATKDIQELDVVQIEEWIVVANRTCAIVEALIASPGRAFHRDYWIELTELETEVERRKGWTREQKLALLRQKRPRTASGAT
jgi:hypothetical protein